MLFRFQIELSDIGRGNYESLDFRVIQHPSETMPYLLTRTIAYCFSYQKNIEFSAKGLSDPDGPALMAKDDNGSIKLWIEVGNPSPKKLHKVNKISQLVKVFTYKNIDLLVEELKEGDIYKADQIEIYSFDSSFINQLSANIKKTNQWSILIQDSQLTINIQELSIETEVKKRSLHKD